MHSRRSRRIIIGAVHVLHGGQVRHWQRDQHGQVVVVVIVTVVGRFLSIWVDYVDGLFEYLINNVVSLEFVVMRSEFGLFLRRNYSILGDGRACVVRWGSECGGGCLLGQVHVARDVV